VFDPDFIVEIFQIELFWVEPNRLDGPKDIVPMHLLEQ
jgi:hypothetical protein